MTTLGQSSENPPRGRTAGHEPGNALIDHLPPHLNDRIRLLYSRRNHVLARLSRLSNGTTGRPVDAGRITARKRIAVDADDPNAGLKRALKNNATTHATPQFESAPPPGTNQARLDTQPVPRQDDDLFAYYVFRFRRAEGDLDAIEKVCAMAERDCYRQLRRTQTLEDPTTRNRRLLDEYAGVSPWEVATWEDCSPESVRRLRVEALLNPDDGLEHRIDDRRRRMTEMRRTGMTHQQIADTFGVSRGRVSQLLAG